MNNICPDHQLLSVYFDGELPSPWKEKMEAHIAACPQCARQLTTYNIINNTAEPVTESELAAARERVWHKLDIPAGFTRHSDRAIWRRRVFIPLPAAAAAFALLAALTVLMVLRLTKTEAPDLLLASEAEMYTPDVIPAADMENVFQYLGGSDSGDIIILRLPESGNFVKYGEPAIIRAADYSRANKPGGRKP